MFAFKISTKVQENSYEIGDTIKDFYEGDISAVKQISSRSSEKLCGINSAVKW